MFIVIYYHTLVFISIKFLLHKKIFYKINLILHNFDEFSKTKINMKKFCVTLLIFCLIIPLCSCAKKNEIPTVNSLEYKTEEELEKIDNINNFSDETIKALSVIVRTNLSKEIDNNEYIVSANASDSNSSRISKLVSETKGQVLNQKENSEKSLSENETTEYDDNMKDLSIDSSINLKTNKKISLYENKGDNHTWSKEIKKSELLKFLKKNNISLSSLSGLSITSDENGNVSRLSVGGKTFNFSDLAEEFELESTKITNIYKTKSSIIIEGEGNKKSNSFDISLAEQEAKNGKIYSEILKNQMKDYDF